MKMGEPRLTLGPPPHRRAATSIAQMNYAFLLALMPAAVVGAVSFGFGHGYGVVAVELPVAAGRGQLS
jgi:hypothetical protein